ncbi:MAG: hypothetical protein WBF77_04790 [Sulfurimonadaceae bacterium]
MDIFGTDLEVIFLLSLWGAVLSTILSVLKIVEYWNNRFQVEVGQILRGDEDLGHDISIKNLSSKPILLEYMELFTKKGNWPFRQKKYIWSPEDSWLNARIEPSDAQVYNFSGSNYFGWNNQNIYVLLYFAGKKPITKKI